MADLTVIKGDYGFNEDITVTDSDDAAYNLTDYTIKFRMWKEGHPETLLVNEACSIVVAASGTCRYPVALGNFKENGMFKGEVELTKSGAKESSIAFDVEVKDSP
jgi:hypothetical protein